MYITSLVRVKTQKILHQTWDIRTWRLNTTQTLRNKTYTQHWYRGAKMSRWSWCGFPKLKIKNSSILRLHIPLTQVLHSTFQEVYFGLLGPKDESTLTFKTSATTYITKYHIPKTQIFSNTAVTTSHFIFPACLSIWQRQQNAYIK